MINDTGILRNESNTAYHKNPAVSHSSLEDYRKRPALYHAKHVAEIIKPTTSAAFTFGSAFHMAVLEPEKFADTYAIQPDSITRRSGKDWKAFVDEAGGREILRPAEADLIDQLQACIAGNLTAAALIEGASFKEVTFRTDMTEYGVALQCRPDGYSPEGIPESAGAAYNLDVKTVDDMDRFLRQFHELGYYRQSPFYRMVQEKVARGKFAPPQRFFYIVVEKAAPHGCTVFEADPLSLRVGEEEVLESLGKLAESVANDTWPNSPELAHATLPDWRVTAYMESAGKEEAA